MSIDDKPLEVPPSYPTDLEDDFINTGKIIKYLRLKKSMTLEELGNKVGVGKSTVRKWENGMIVNMRKDKILKIAKALDVTPTYLMGWEDTPLSETVNIGHRIKERRLELGYSVDQLAELLNKNRATVYRYENGDIEHLPHTVLQPIAKALDTTIEYLISEQEDNQKSIFSLNLRYLLSNKNVPQIEVANKIGVSPQTFNTWVQGIAYPRMDKIQMLADYFSIRKSDLIEKRQNINTTMTIGERIKLRREELQITQEELAQKLGYKSRSSINKIELGGNELTQRKIMDIAHALQTTPSYIMGWLDDVVTEEPTPKRKGVVIPVLGHVAAGIPIEMIEDIIDTEEIPEDMAKHGEFFALKIKGDSMTPSINNSDVVIVRQQEDAENGDIVIAAINGNDAVCKRLKKYSDGISLISLNPAYEPLYFNASDVQEAPVKIIGKVVELRRKF